MPKKNKKRKAGNSKKGGGYKKFLLDMQEVLDQAGLSVRISEIPNGFKRMLYDHRVRVANPVAANALVSSRELKNIATKTKSYYRQKKIKFTEASSSTYQLMLLHCFTSVRLIMMKKELGKNDPEVYRMKQATDDLFKAFYANFIADYFRIITQLGNPCHKYFGMIMRPAAIVKDNPMMELVIEIYGVPARKLSLLVDGIKRPAYQLGKPMAREEPVEWLTVNSSLLGDYYPGKQSVLEVYIQSHVMERLSQRLDLLDRAAINYLIWENTQTITKFEIYKGYLLLPVKLLQVKVGYLLAKIVEDKILFRTFLFITHRLTPEGDKLAELTGLDKQDIMYWRIDRLSSFVNFNEEAYQGLLELFRQSGIEDFSTLREQDFDIDRLQSVNLDGLMEYLKGGRQDDHLCKS